MRRVTLLAVMMWLPLVAEAAVPACITVQGKLTDSLGAPLPAGPKSFVFKIFDAPTLGAEVWPNGPGENQSLVSDPSGLWIGLVGAVVPLTDAVFSDTSRWLEITVDGTTLPRVRLVTGPYAHRVATVDGASGGTISSKVSIGPGHINSGDHAFIAGIANVTTGDTTVVAGGTRNTASGPGASIIGGADNSVSGSFSIIGGGLTNSAAGVANFIGGGSGNHTENNNAVIVGGRDNAATGFGATIAGGINDSALASAAVVGGGAFNSARADYAAVSGGRQNAASGQWAFVGGGWRDSALARGATVSGGETNVASGNWSTIGGGATNAAPGQGATIGGGGGNIATGPNSVIGGGELNRAGATGSTISGGYDSDADSAYTTIGGGYQNRARAGYGAILGGRANLVDYNGLFGTVSGGLSNRAVGPGATVAGGRNCFADSNGAVGGGYADSAKGNGSFVGGGFYNTASALQSSVVGGFFNRATGYSSTIGGGGYNRTSGWYSVVAGGGGSGPADSNSAVGNYAVIGGGSTNTAAGDYSVVTGGRRNRAAAGGGTIAGGYDNYAQGNYSTVGGGQADSAFGNFATIPGGQLNRAAGHNSFAAGYLARANHDGAFVWADGIGASFTSTGANQFLVRAGGGVGINTSQPETPLHVLKGSTPVAGSAWPYSIANFEHADNGYISITTPDINERGILFADASSNVDGAIIYNSTIAGVPDGFQFRTSGNQARVNFYSNGDVLAVGSITAWGSVCAFNGGACVSDGRLKTEVVPLTNALDAVERLRGVTYRWKHDVLPDHPMARGEQIGLIAQEVKEVVPQAVTETREGLLAIDYARLVPYLIEGMKEQQRQIDEQRAMIDELREKLRLSAR
ncbi:MAG TPA: tail fiber domain-containing protein [bacterium]|nr:tail fiber domain-containing protein [bacterium]